MQQIFIWIGPSIKGTILNTFTIFADGIPADYKDNKNYRNLFVTPDKLEDARREIGKKGSYLNILYRKILEGVD